MPSTARIDYPTLTRTGFLVSVALLAVGFVGSWLTAGVAGVPAWEHALFFDAEVLGTLGIFLVPFVFGVALPLLE
ncbi:MAG: hypothetical protein ABEJ76_04905 [Halanaeroarchaeum sp.]